MDIEFSAGQVDETTSRRAPRSPYRRGRRIGPWGTATRALAGLGLWAWGLAVPHAHPWLGLPGAGSRPWGILLGLVVIPGVLTLAMRLRGAGAPRLHLGLSSAVAVTAIVLALMQVYPVAMMVAIGSTLLVLAVVGRGGCEVLAAPNLLLGRHDSLICLPFTPLDRWELRRGAHQPRR